MNLYADTSFLVSVYTPDANSPEAASIIKSAPLPILLTPFLEFELMNAFHLRLFRREIDLAQAREASAVFRADIEAGVLAPLEMPADAFVQARKLTIRFTSRLGTRSLDVLHVGCAVALGAELFQTFDKGQWKLAKAAGLKAL